MAFKHFLHFLTHKDTHHDPLPLPSSTAFFALARYSCPDSHSRRLRRWRGRQPGAGTHPAFRHGRDRHAHRGRHGGCALRRRCLRLERIRGHRAARDDQRHRRLAGRYHGPYPALRAAGHGRQPAHGAGLPFRGPGIWQHQHHAADRSVDRQCCGRPHQKKAFSPHASLTIRTRPVYAATTIWRAYFPSFVLKYIEYLLLSPA